MAWSDATKLRAAWECASWPLVSSVHPETQVYFARSYRTSLRYRRLVSSDGTQRICTASIGASQPAVRARSMPCAGGLIAPCILRAGTEPHGAGLVLTATIAGAGRPSRLARGYGGFSRRRRR